MPACRGCRSRLEPRVFALAGGGTRVAFDCSVSSAFRFDRRSDRARDLEVEEPEPAPARRYARALAPGKRPLTARVYRSATGPAAASEGGTREVLARAADAGGGSPLPAELRALLEQALGVSLAGIRLHQDGASAAAAAAIGARAYTIGRDVHFASGSFAPDDPDGQRLIAHEVAHAVLHAGRASPAGDAGAIELSQPGDAAELEADRFAEAFVAGRPAEPVAAAAAPAARPVVHRDPDPAASVSDEHRAALALARRAQCYR